MPLSSAIVGAASKPLVTEIDSRWTMAYAAALGDSLPAYFDTTRESPVIAHPMFPICFEWPLLVGMRSEFGATGLTTAEALRGVHATHDLVIHRPIRAGERISTQLTIAGVEHRKPGAYMVSRLDTVDDGGTPICTTWYGSLYRGVTVDGADQPAKTVALPAPPIVEEGAPLDEAEIDVPAGMAHVYTECARIFNPIHTDAAVARAAGLPSIILHGTATLAIAVSRVVEVEAKKDSTRLARIAARFGAMVTMPSILTVRILARDAAADGTQVFFEALNSEGRLAIRDGLVSLRN
jgi:acyl dehydratase